MKRWGKFVIKIVYFYFNAKEVQKNSSRFQENIAVIAAQTTGKGLALDIIE
jgi:hypothetical protein